MKFPQAFKMATRSENRVARAELQLQVDDSEKASGPSLQLPIELVALILSYAASTGDPAANDTYTNDSRPLSVHCRKQAQPILYISALVSKHWNHIATELLYESIYLTSPRSLSIISDTLSHRKELRALVRRFIYAPPKDSSAGALPGNLPLSSWLVVRRIYSMCPQLASRTIKKSETRSKRYGRLWRQKRFLYFTHPLNTINLTRTSGTHVQSLTKLEIESIQVVPAMYIPETLVFPQLQDLTLKGFNTRHFGHASMTYPTMPQLIRLHFKNCSFYGVAGEVPLPKNCPHLRIFEFVGGCLFQMFWGSFGRLIKETHIESFTFTPSSTTGSGRPPANNLNALLPDLHDMHINADCLVWETNPTEVTLMIPNKVRHLVVEASTKLNYTNYSMQWIASIQNSVKWLLDHKTSYGLELESIIIWAYLDKVAWERHSDLEKQGEREGVKIKMFDKTPRASTRLSRALYKLSPMF